MRADETAIPERVRAWISQVRTAGFSTLWQRMGDAERQEMIRFASAFDRGFQLEVEGRWQDAADCYRTVGEQYPAWADIAFQRAGQVVNDKINRAIRYYNQGVQAMEARMYAKAMQYFELALNVDPFMEKALYNLGMSHRMLYIADPVGQRLERAAAIEVFRRLLKMNPDHARAAAQIDQLSKL